MRRVVDRGAAAPPRALHAAAQAREDPLLDVLVLRTPFAAAVFFFGRAVQQTVFVHVGIEFQFFKRKCTIDRGTQSRKRNVRGVERGEVPRLKGAVLREAVVRPDEIPAAAMVRTGVKEVSTRRTRLNRRDIDIVCFDLVGHRIPPLAEQHPFPPNSHIIKTQGIRIHTPCSGCRQRHRGRPFRRRRRTCGRSRC